MADNPAIAVSATAACGENVNETNGRAIVKIGVVSAAAGMNRPRIPAIPTALAAMAPENPATNDVQPLRNPTRGP